MGSFILNPSPTFPKRPADTSFPTVYPNPPVYQHAGTVGERTFWVVFVLMVIATVCFAAMTWTVPTAKRIYHSITTLIVIIGGLSYFAMANGGGLIEHHRRIPEHHIDPLPPTHWDIFRDVYYVRYIDWLLTTPLLLLDLSLLAGLNGASIFSAIAADVIMVLTGLFAALSHTKREKWGWYTISCISFIWVLYTLVITGISTARAKSSTVSKFYTMIAGYSVLVWIAYPIIWAIGAKRLVTVDGEIIAFAVLDILAKIVFGAWLLFTQRTLPESQVELGGFWTHGFNSEGRIRVGNGDSA